LSTLAHMEPAGTTAETSQPLRASTITRRPLRPRLGDVLIAAGVLSAEQLDRALSEQRAWGGRLGQILLSLGLLDEIRLASAIARQLGLPTVDLDRAQLRPAVTQLLPLELAERYGLMPLGSKPVEGRVLVACFDPTDTGAQAAAARATGLVPLVHVATASSIDRAIRRYYYGEAAPTPTPGDPRFTVTRHTMAPALAVDEARALGERVVALEQKVEALSRRLVQLTGRRPGER